MSLYNRIFESDEEIQKLERSSRANPGDLPLHRRLAGKLTRAGRHRDAVSHTKELVKAAASSTAPARQSIKFRALRRSVRSAQQAFMASGRAYDRIRPYTSALKSAWNSKRWAHKSHAVRAQHRKTAKNLARHVRRVAERHGHDPHNLLDEPGTGTEMENYPHEDAEFMAHLYGARDGHHREGGRDDGYQAVGHAIFDTQHTAWQFAGSLEDRHGSGDVDVRHSGRDGKVGHRVEYGINPTVARSNWSRSN